MNLISLVADTIRLQDWTHLQLARCFIDRKAICFILDSDFGHFSLYEKSVNFICEVFDELKSNDYFALKNLGD